MSKELSCEVFTLFYNWSSGYTVILKKKKFLKIYSFKILFSFCFPFLGGSLAISLSILRTPP